MKLKILIVDDDKKLLSVLKNMLMDENNTVSTCTDGSEAISMCDNNKYDLVITDLMLPGANGLEILKKVRKIDPDVLVILITGYASLETAIQAIREGAYDYITKPFRLEEIRIVVNNARERLHLKKENQRLVQQLRDASLQLHMMRKIISEDYIKEDEVIQESENDAPFITGSMLPLYYAENNGEGVEAPVISDLERISTLREKGLLSNEEFDLCKSKLLNNTKQ